MRLGTLLGPDLKQLLQEDPEQLNELLDDIHAEDLADILGELEPAEVAIILEKLQAEEAAPIFERLDEHEQEDLVERMPPESVAQIASEMAPDDRADLFSVLPDAVGDKLLVELDRVDPEAAEDVRAIEKWPDTSAGHLMTTSFVSVNPDVTVADAVLAVRKHVEDRDEQIYNVYATRKDQLEGIVPLRDLLLASPSQKLWEILRTKIISVTPETDQEEVARRMAKYDLNVMPVIDGGGVLLGVITIDDVIDVLTQEQTEDVQRLGAVEPLDVPYFQTSFLTFIRKRAGWLIILFVEEFFTQTALRYYDPVMEAVKGALLYVPLLISAGGNSGSQSSTLVIRGLALGEIKLKDWWRIAVRELGMGIVLGIMLSFIAVGRVLMYPDQHILFALTVGVTLIGIVVTGCTIGSMLPIIMKRFGVDPATSSTPFIASIVDTLGVIIYAHVAMIIMHKVIDVELAGHPLH
ncbi:MAG: magnesium transporter [Polyangiaceae bacterium]